jgi:tetratricopeptide (TPR) repeat protein
MVTIGIEDYDLSGLPEDFRDRNAPGFNAALRESIEIDYGNSGLFVSVHIDEILIHITQDKKSEEKLESAIHLLQKSDYKSGKKILAALLNQYPNNTVVLYNLGMIYSDEGDLDQAIKLLSLATEKNDDHAHAWTALAVAYMRASKIDLALKAATRANKVTPDDPYVLRTLGTLLAQSGNNTEAIIILEKAVRHSPGDPFALLSLAESLKANNTEESNKRADHLYKKVIDLVPGSAQSEMAKDRRRELAYEDFRKNDDKRPDAIAYCLDALNKISRMTEQEITGLAMEAATLGQSGLEVNNPDKLYELRTIPGYYSGLNVVCILHTAIQKLTPGTDSGFDVQAEFEEALKLNNENAQI